MSTESAPQRIPDDVRLNSMTRSPMRFPPVMSPSPQSSESKEVKAFLGCRSAYRHQRYSEEQIEEMLKDHPGNPKNRQKGDVKAPPAKLPVPAGRGKGAKQAPQAPKPKEATKPKEDDPKMNSGSLEEEGQQTEKAEAAALTPPELKENFLDEAEGKDGK